MRTFPPRHGQKGVSMMDTQTVIMMLRGARHCEFRQAVDALIAFPKHLLPGQEKFCELKRDFDAETDAAISEIIRLSESKKK